MARRLGATAGDFDPQTQQFTLSVVAADPQGLWLSGWASTCPASLDGGSGPDAGGGAADAGAPDSGDAGGGGGGPVYPVLVALGDSIPSGHHGGGSTKAVCDDAAYGYPSTVFYNLQNTDVANWSQGTYVNYAHSGFGTAKVIDGGTTPCGDSFTSPLTSAENALTAHLNPVAPNRVAVSARVADFLSWIDYALTVAGSGKTTAVSPTPLNGNNSMLQQLTTSWWRPATNGWPHPNGTGHQAIADLIVPAPISCTCSADCNPTGQVSVGGLCTGGDPLAPNANLSGALSSACANEGEDFILNAGSISCSPGVDGGIEF